MNRNVTLALIAGGLGIAAAVALFVLFGPESVTPGQPAIPHAADSTAAVITEPFVPENIAPTGQADPTGPAGERPAGPPPQKDRPTTSRVQEDEEPLQIEGVPEDGGKAFGNAVCERQKSCGCREHAAATCLRTWQWVTPGEYASVKCLLDLDCESLCSFKTAPGAESCRATTKAVTDAHFSGR